MTPPWRATSSTMSAGRAPSAERTPISRRRCATLYARTPNNPTPAITMAHAPNPTEHDGIEPRLRQVRQHAILHRHHRIERDRRLCFSHDPPQRRRERRPDPMPCARRESD